jgi:hypothetical protein
MDPFTATAVTPALLKAGAGFAAGPAKSFLGQRTMRIRVAFSASRAAKKRGIRVSQLALRRWLMRSDVHEQMGVGTADAIVSAMANLAWVMGGTEEERHRRAPELLFIILTAFIRAHDPAEATALSAAWLSQQITGDGRATRDVVDMSRNAILDRLSASRVFADDVRRLHPWRRESVEELEGIWPDVVGFVHTFVSAPDRSALLLQWEQSPPEQFLAAPAEAWCWFGLLAADYGEGTVAANFIERGIERGAFPKNYWLARAAMHLDSDNRSRSEALLAEAADPHPLGRGIAAIHEGDFATATERFSGWQAETGSDRAIKAALLSQSLAAQQNLNRAITVAVEGAEDEHAGGLAVHAANLLLSRARYGPSDHPLADSDQALALALRARNARRA